MQIKLGWCYFYYLKQNYLTLDFNVQRKYILKRKLFSGFKYYEPLPHSSLVPLLCGGCSRTGKVSPCWGLYAAPLAQSGQPCEMQATDGEEIGLVLGHKLLTAHISGMLGRSGQVITLLASHNLRITVTIVHSLAVTQI